MSRDKQIEIDEMAKDLCHTDTCEIKKIGIPCNHRCKAHIYATRAIEKDYRKSTDVAEEIFAEIEKKVKASLTIHLEEINKEHIKDTPLYDRCSGIVFALRQIEDYLAELKKKYTETERSENGKS